MSACKSMVFTDQNGTETKVEAKRFLKKDGSNLYVELTTTALDAGGNPVKLISQKSVDEIKSVNSNISIGGIKIPLDFGNIAKAINAGSDTAVKILGTLVDFHTGAVGTTAQSLRTKLAARLYHPYKKAYEDIFTEHLKSLGRMSAKERRVQKRLFNDAIYHLRNGDEEMAYKVAGHGGYVSSSGKPDPLALQRKASGVYSEMAVKFAKENGLPEDPNYTPVSLHVDETRKILTAIGGGDINAALKSAGSQIFGPAIAAASGVKLKASEIEAVGEVYIRKMYESFHGRSSHSRFRKIDDEVQAVAAELEAAGLDKASAAKMAMGMVNVADPATPGHLKHRIAMDRTYKTKITGVDGKTYEVSVSDFMNKDVEGLFDGYAHNMLHYMSMKEYGLHDRAAFEALTTRVRAEMASSGKTDSDITSMLNALDYVWHQSMGYPPRHNEHTLTNRAADMLMKLTSIKLLGKYPISNMLEMGMPAAYGGTRAMQAASGIKNMFETYMAALNDMPLDHPMMRTLQAMGASDSLQKILYMPENPHFEDSLAYAEHKVDLANNAHAKLTARRSFSVYQQMTASVSVLQSFLDLHTGRRSDVKLVERVARSGIKHEHVKDVFDDMVKYSKTTPDGIIKDLDYAKWMEDNPQTYATFTEALIRERNFILNAENKLDLPALVGDTKLGAMFTQLRQWMAPMYQRKVLSGIAKGDMMAMSGLMHSMVIAMAVRYAQNRIEYANDKEKLDKENQFHKLLLNSFAQSGYAFFLPSATDSAAQLLGYNPVFQNVRYSGASGLAPASLGTLDSIKSVGSGLLNAASHRELTQGNVKQMLSPLPTFLGRTALIHSIVNDLPVKHQDKLKNVFEDQ